jgi:hypothetical protein
VKRFVSAGFGEPLIPRLGEACQRVARGIRTDVPVGDDHARVKALVRNALTYFDESVFIVGGWLWRIDGKLVSRPDVDLEPLKDHLADQCRSLINSWRDAGADLSKLWIEIGNELDISWWGKNHLDAFHRTAMTCYERVRSLSQAPRFVTGSTSNFNKGFSWRRDGYECLDDLCELQWPKDTIQGLHPYRGPAREWPSFDNDAAALRELRKVLGGRALAITEMGWDSTPDGSTDNAIALWTRDEIAMWRDFGAECWTWFQIQDAEKPIEDRFGRYGCYSNLQDGLEPKPVAAVLGEELVKA